MVIAGVDPGFTQSAFLLLDATKQRIVDMGFYENNELLAMLRIPNPRMKVFAIEEPMPFGFVCGVEVFKTILWTGQFMEAVRRQPTVYVMPVGRKRLVAHHTGTAKGNDSAIRTAMIKRFGDATGCTYDLWQALSVAAFAADKLHASEVTDT